MASLARSLGRAGQASVFLLLRRGAVFLAFVALLLEQVVAYGHGGVGQVGCMGVVDR